MIVFGAVLTSIFMAGGFCAREITHLVQELREAAADEERRQAAKKTAIGYRT